MRIRVMSSCFLVLLRHNLRVDGVFVHQHDVRLFHKFGSGVVLRSSRTARTDLAPLPSSMAMRATAVGREARAHGLAEGAVEGTRMPLAATTMPMQSTLRLPPTTTVAPPTTTVAPPFTTTAPTSSAIPPITTAAPPRKLRMPAPERPLPGDTRRPMEPPRGSPRGFEPPTGPLGHRAPLDEQKIAEILQRVDAVEHTEEFEIAPARGVPTPMPTGLAAPANAAACVPDSSPTTAPPLSLLAAPLRIDALSAPLSVLTVCPAGDGGDGGQWLLGADADGALVLLRLSPSAADAHALASEVWRIAQAHRGAVLAADMLPGGKTIVTCGEDGSCAAWDVASAGDAGEAAVRWHLDCTSADRVHSSVPADPTSADPTGRGYVRRSLAVVQQLACEPEVHSARFAAAVGASIFLLAATEIAPRRKLNAGCAVTALEYVHARRVLCAAGYGGVRVWNEYGDGACSTLRYFGPLDSLAISPDARYAASGAQDSTLVLWPLGRSASATDGAAPEVHAPAADRVPQPAPLPDVSDPTTASHVADAAIKATAPPPTDPRQQSLHGDSPLAETASTIRCEADAALHSGSALFFGGTYEQKVGPLAWGAAGRLCASAGGRRVAVWDMGQDGAPPPVRQNGRAQLVCAHSAVVTWLGFQPPPTAVDGGMDGGDGGVVGGDGPTTMLASAASDGRVMIHRLDHTSTGRPQTNTAGVRSPPPASARFVTQPVAASAAGMAARTSPVAWAANGWLVFSNRDCELVAARVPSAEAAS